MLANECGFVETGFEADEACTGVRGIMIGRASTNEMRSDGCRLG